MARRNSEHDSRRYFDWLDKAAQDIRSARILIEHGEDTNHTAAFHCQQCIEKALKAYLLFKNKAHLDGHNLTYLCRQAVYIDNYFTDWLDESAVLNRYYIETRYPSDKPMIIGDAQLGRIYNMALKMYGFIYREIKNGSKKNMPPIYNGSM